jgi:hypothetical protein
LTFSFLEFIKFIETIIILITRRLCGIAAGTKIRKGKPRQPEIIIVNKPRYAKCSKKIISEIVFLIFH